MTTLFLFRNDLRLDDNPGFAKAAANGPVVPIFIYDPDAMGTQAPGGAARWWLHHSLMALDQSLRDIGSRLIVRKGDAFEETVAIAHETEADAVHLSRGYAPWDIDLEVRLHDALNKSGCSLRRFGGNILFEPEAVTTLSGDPYKVFTPFWRACLKLDPPLGHTPAPAKLDPPSHWPQGITIDDLRFMPAKPDWSSGLAANWRPGESGALERLSTFLEDAAEDYKNGRDIPSVMGTSRLSPHLKWGEISPRAVWRAVKNAEVRGEEPYIRELGWRDFAHHLIFRFPSMHTKPLREEFTDVPWRNGGEALERWQKGQTGYPIVDAGMRELWHTGWMHNRVRMITASFLVKHLLIDWRSGAAWFMDTLVDADPANNNAGWQWVAGCGTDAAPYFRVFNPTLQGEKFDGQGDYVRHWVPELAHIPDRFLHQPWEAGPLILSEAGVTFGTDYPEPIVDHKLARTRALEAYKVVKHDRS